MEDNTDASRFVDQSLPFSGAHDYSFVSTVLPLSSSASLNPLTESTLDNAPANSFNSFNWTAFSSSYEIPECGAFPINDGAPDLSFTGSLAVSGGLVATAPAMDELLVARSSNYEKGRLSSYCITLYRY